MAMWLSKLLKTPTNPGKVKITEKRVNKSCTLFGATYPASSGFSTGHYTTKGFSPFSSVVSGGETKARRVDIYPARTFLKGTRFHVTG